MHGRESPIHTHKRELGKGVGSFRVICESRICERNLFILQLFDWLTAHQWINIHFCKFSRRSLMHVRRKKKKQIFTDYATELRRRIRTPQSVLAECWLRKQVSKHPHLG